MKRYIRSSEFDGSRGLGVNDCKNILKEFGYAGKVNSRKGSKDDQSPRIITVKVGSNSVELSEDTPYGIAKDRIRQICE